MVNSYDRIGVINAKGDSRYRALAIQVMIQRNTFLTEEAEYIAFGK
jgi:hypothetical protein